MSNYTTKQNRGIEDTLTPNVQSSTFDLSHGRKTTFNAGQLVPVMFKEVLPGDTFEVDTTALIRSSSLIAPTMDQAEVSVNYFFVPNRLVWDDWKAFMGEFKNGTWYDKHSNYTIPQLVSPRDGFDVHSIADHLGLPVKQNIGSVSHIPFRSFVEIYNEWYRDENLQLPLLNFKHSQTHNGLNLGLNVDNPEQARAIYGSTLPNVNKHKDYFTSCLPSPQKGEDVIVRILGLNDVEIYTQDGQEFRITNFDLQEQHPYPISGEYGGGVDIVGALEIFTSETDKRYSERAGTHEFGTQTVPQGWTKSKGLLYHPLLQRPATTSQPAQQYGITNPTPRRLSTITGESVSGLTLGDGPRGPAGININQLRQLIAQQKYLETDALGGTRYIEKIYAHFGVMTEDARVNRPEFLGGSKFSIDVNQVAQTSETTDNSPQGNLSAYSITQTHKKGFKKSFTEHGIIMGVLSVKTQQTYQYGVSRYWKNKDVLDFYFPEFAHLGEQPVYNYEIYADGTANDNQVFGYNSAFAYLKFPTSSIAGDFNSRSDAPLDVWHFAEKRDACPTLSEQFIKQTDHEVNRTLAVQSNITSQYFGDIFFSIKAHRKMPLYSIPKIVG